MIKERKFQIEQLLETPQALLHKEQISQQVSGKIIQQYLMQLEAK